MLQIILQKVLARYKRFKYNRAIAAKALEARFNNIYKEKLWDGKGQSRSGAGSSLEATKNIREVLPKLLREINAKSLVDVGCGDFYWMKEVDLPCEYFGLDIVKDVIEENRLQYANDMRKFYHHNAVEEKLPEQSDVVFCREVLFHLSYEDGLKLIKQLINSNARYFLATTSLQIKENIDIRSGQFRNINLLKSPYSFPPYSMKIEDSESLSSDRYLALWDVHSIREAIS